ncbi:SIR2 family protein [Actinoplanes sp. NPDC049681]|uniref:SIR2 family protein n=1 Tax=Actinoplanes sp. NPDC049681 TaxID=3363905 RepID=UPI0037B11EC1
MTSVEPDPAGEGLSAGEQLLLDRLMTALHDADQITLLLGSGVTAAAVPGVRGVLEIADSYAAGRNDDGALERALAQARSELVGARPIDVYRAYRRVFTDWVSGGAFDVIAQQAVLKAYAAPDPMESPLATHGLGQRLERGVGEGVENDRFSWSLPRGVQALGHLLARIPEAFDHRLLTTNFDPLLEIAIRDAGGRAVSLPLDVRGNLGHTGSSDGAVRVFHLHGFWRPTLHVRGPQLLHDPALLTGNAPLIAAAADLIRGDTVCVIGSSDWAGTITAALARTRPMRVLWALNDADAATALSTAERLREQTGVAVECFPGVDSERLFPALAERAQVPVPPRATGLKNRVRHHSWERQLVSQPGTLPPRDVPGLLLQLERRFGWVTQMGGTVQPIRLLWPVRLRPRASVIHMVQAFVAGALARLGVEVRVCIDDVGTRDHEAQTEFRADLDRWIDHTGHGAVREFVSLAEFLDQGARHPAAGSPEELLRPTDPWSVARTFYGEHNPSLYSLLAAVKAVPNLTSWDELEKNAWPIVQSVLRTDARNLLTPLTLWPYLNSMLLESATNDVMTLGGRDEAILWAQWRQTFGFGPGHLYNPYIKNLQHDAHMLRWSSQEELSRHLHRSRELPGWDVEGSYIPWLFQNALLLPGYLNQEPVPETEDFPLDSWAAFVAAIEDGKPVLDDLAARVTALFLR